MKVRLLSLVLALLPLSTATPGPATATDRTPLYYQDPDGKPAYSANPKKTSEGRDYVPVYADGSQGSGAASSRSSGPSARSADRGRVLFYRNPMGLPDTSPVPKKDAMGMAYLPVYENEIRDAGTVFVPPGRLQILGVRTSVAAVQPVLNRSVHATGIAQFDERRIALVTSRVGGWVEHLDIAATGDPVWRGQVMAEIYAPDLVASEQEYLIATSLDPAMATAALERLRSLGAPETEIARLRRTRHAVRHIPVVAPADGVVTEKMAVGGARVGPDQPLYRTAATAPIWLIAEVQEQDLGAVRVGQQAHASLVAFPGRRFDGTVDFLYPSVSTETRTGRIRIVLPNADSVLRAGMYADIAIDVPASMAGPVLVVPSSSVIDSGTRQVVLVETGEGRFAPRSVRVGARGNDEAQILDGLKAGESVVVGANFLIDSESNLRAALQAFTVPDSKPARAGSAGR